MNSDLWPRRYFSTRPKARKIYSPGRSRLGRSGRPMGRPFAAEWAVCGGVDVLVRGATHRPSPATSTPTSGMLRFTRQRATPGARRRAPGAFVQPLEPLESRLLLRDDVDPGRGPGVPSQPDPNGRPALIASSTFASPSPTTPGRCGPRGTRSPPTSTSSATTAAPCRRTFPTPGRMKRQDAKNAKTPGKDYEGGPATSVPPLLVLRERENETRHCPSWRSSGSAAGDG
jgi:hypothetical protein